MLRVLIADDHAFTRLGLKQFLMDTRIVSAIGQAASGQETLSRLRAEGPWQVLVLDIDMPGRGGLEILRQVRAQYPDIRVLVVSGFPEQQYAVQAIRAGAHGYLPKGALVTDFKAALMAVVEGRKYVSAALAEQLVADLQVEPRDKRPHERFSEREFQVFCKLAVGRDTATIVRDLCLGRKSVSNYRSRIFRKLEVGSQAELMKYARDEGLTF